MDSDAAERLHHLVVAGVLDEYGCRGIGSAGGIDVGAAINSTVIENNKKEYN